MWIVGGAGRAIQRHLRSEMVKNENTSREAQASEHAKSQTRKPVRSFKASQVRKVCIREQVKSNMGGNLGKLRVDQIQPDTEHYANYGVALGNTDCIYQNGLQSRNINEMEGDKVGENFNVFLEPEISIFRINQVTLSVCLFF